MIVYIVLWEPTWYASCSNHFMVMVWKYLKQLKQKWRETDWGSAVDSTVAQTNPTQGHLSEEAFLNNPRTIAYYCTWKSPPLLICNDFTLPWHPEWWKSLIKGMTVAEGSLQKRKELSDLERMQISSWVRTSLKLSFLNSPSHLRNYDEWK